MESYRNQKAEKSSHSPGLPARVLAVRNTLVLLLLITQYTQASSIRREAWPQSYDSQKEEQITEQNPNKYQEKPTTDDVTPIGITSTKERQNYQGERLILRLKRGALIFGNRRNGCPPRCLRRPVQQPGEPAEVYILRRRDCIRANHCRQRRRVHRT